MAKSTFGQKYSVNWWVNGYAHLSLGQLSVNEGLSLFCKQIDSMSQGFVSGYPWPANRLQ